MRRRAILFLPLIALLLLSTLSFSEEWKKDYATGAAPTLQVQTNDAGVEVHASTGTGISARITTSNYSIGPNGVRVNEYQSGDTVSLQVKIPNHWGLSFGNRNVHIEISVPQQTRLEISSSDGALRVSGTHAEAHLNTSDGAIRVADFDGPLHARTADGSIEAAGRFDQLDLNTSDGHITVEARAGSRVGTGWSLRTSDGSIHLRIPVDLAADVDAWTSDGRITVSVPLLVEGTQAHNRVHGRLNGGGMPIRIHTGDGSVHIDKL